MDQFFKNFQAGFQSFPGMQNFKAPQFDVNQWFALQRKNMEALSTANHIISEGAQAIARRSAEFLRENVEDALNATREVMTNTTAPEKSVAKTVEFTKQTAQTGMEQFREVGDMAAKSQIDAFEVVSARFAKSFEEAKTLAEKQAA